MVLLQGENPLAESSCSLRFFTYMLVCKEVLIRIGLELPYRLLLYHVLVVAFETFHELHVSQAMLPDFIPGLARSAEQNHDSIHDLIDAGRWVV